MGRYEDLENLQKLKEKGSITDKEYEMEKYKVLTSTEAEKKNTTDGIYGASLGVGIISFLLGSVPIIGIIICVVGIVISIKASKRMKQNGETKGIVTAGLVLSILGLLIGIVFTFGTLGTFIINSRTVL